MDSVSNKTCPHFSYCSMTDEQLRQNGERRRLYEFFFCKAGDVFWHWCKRYQVLRRNDSCPGHVTPNSQEDVESILGRSGQGTS